MSHLFTDTIPSSQHDLASTTRYQGELLRNLLVHDARCRRLWQSRVDRASRHSINSAAVARVLAEWFWDTGQVSEADHELPRRLKDIVSRGLRGEQLSRKTLEAFIGAFALNEKAALELTDPYLATSDEAA